MQPAEEPKKPKRKIRRIRQYGTALCVNEGCGRHFVRRSPKHKYCDTCQNKVKAIITEAQKERACEWCSKPFKADRRNRLFCSKPHRILYWKKVIELGRQAYAVWKHGAGATAPKKARAPRKKKEEKK